MPLHRGIGALLILTASIGLVDQPRPAAQKEKSAEELIVELYNLRVEAARADLKYVELDLRRQEYVCHASRVLFARRAISEDDYQEALVDREKARVKVEITRLDIKEQALVAELVRRATVKKLLTLADLKFFLHDAPSRAGK